MRWKLGRPTGWSQTLCPTSWAHRKALVWVSPPLLPYIRLGGGAAGTGAKEAPSLPVFSAPQITQQGETQTPDITSSFPWLPRRGCQGGRKARAPLPQGSSTPGNPLYGFPHRPGLCHIPSLWQKTAFCLPTHVWLMQETTPELEHRWLWTFKSYTQSKDVHPCLSQESFMWGRSPSLCKNTGGPKCAKVSTEQPPVLN